MGVDYNDICLQICGRGIPALGEVALGMGPLAGPTEFGREMGKILSLLVEEGVDGVSFLVGGRRSA